MSDRTALYRTLFRAALRIRRVEEAIIDVYPSDKILSPVHLSIGQEAAAVGVCAHLSDEDLLFINYRGHAFFLAKGGSLTGMMAELYGKRAGVCGGKGGSMHLAAPDCGVMGASAVVASTISHALGAALIGRIRGDRRLCVSVFGDGATEQGTYHECLNFAAVNALPVLLVCENNGLAVHASLAERQSYSIATHAAAYGIQTRRVENGGDLLAVYDASQDAIRTVRDEHRPCVLEIVTSRYREHVGPGEDFHFGYRAIDDVAPWKQSDPLETDRDLIAEFDPDIRAEIADAMHQADAAAFPPVEDVMTDVV